MSGVVQITFSENTADERGGAIFVDKSSSSPTFDDVLILGREGLKELSCPVDFPSVYSSTATLNNTAQASWPKVRRDIDTRWAVEVCN